MPFSSRSLCRASSRQDHHGLKRALKPTRHLHTDGRSRLSNFWIPTGGLSKNVDPATGAEDSHDMLLRGGFIRQTHSGLYHFLPLGQRVQAKVEALLDKHMASVGASKVALSTLSAVELWEKSGRWEADKTEFFRLNDRRDTGFLLAPTHEEEITSLVAAAVYSYKDLPLRLYQITRKYRDELRPRQGLLRTREFVMKDLYTFDNDRDAAVATYEDVGKAYKSFFDEFKRDYLVSKADSGDIGGEFSHEYHYASPKGEDDVYSCSDCGQTVNGELLGQDPSKHACPSCDGKQLASQKTIELGHTFFLGTKYSEPLNARAVQRTSEGATAATDKSSSSSPPSTTAPAVQMGCYGIGVSRLIATMADLKADDKGLNWPKVMAPFTVAIVPTKGCEDDAMVLHDILATLPAQAHVDSVMDDRAAKGLAWKLNDADLVGYPVIVVLGRSWKAERRPEVQCRQLGVKQEVDMVDLSALVRELLSKL